MLSGLGGGGSQGCTGDFFCAGGAFFEGVDGVGGEVFEAFDEAAGPADFDPVDLDGGAKAEVDAGVVVGDVAGAAADFVDESAGAGFDEDSCADAIAIGG